ncbi:MAG: cysteine--tRNA ligase [Firmicutes bacterium]|nr:cysteine--tRNA ligase [Bacillota bacterium]MBQ4234721.1 cysteine--tRNA ligase [Bacillota bacterium]
MKIYNTMSRHKEELIPQNPKVLTMYVCGPTVYNYIHIGNARPFVVFDTMRKYLEYRGQKVKYVQNFTDVDDKIINRAREEGITAMEVADKYIQAYYEDAKALNITRATVHPRVSETIPDIIAFVQGLIDKGMAYEVNGDVYYRTRKFTGYGKLSGQNIDDLEAGARIQVGDIKEDPLDFALWKARKSEDEIAWESPWGMGRPGWHIECSAMSKKYLGTTIDLHAGGEDLQFPHHENEIAQSEGLSGQTFSRYWMHNGFITVNNEKMSKSAGNFFLVRDILKEYDGEVLRFFLLSAQYRGPVNFSRELMEQAKAGLERMRNCKASLKHMINTQTGTMTEDEAKKLEALGVHKEHFIAFMDDDLNTADAISAIFELVKDINTAIAGGCSREFAEKALALLTELTGVLGLLIQEPKVEVEPEIQALIDARQAARKEKNWAEADRIRDELAAKGIQLKDTPQGVQIVRI